MNVTALPILRRELRVASRRSATYWSRFRTALAGVVPTALLLVGAIRANSPAQIGAHIFYALSFLSFLFALLGAVWLPSDSLSAEKREGTLGFLFLTDLKPYDVVLGKLAASSLTGLYALVALLPILAIPMLCGGVTLGDFVRLTLVLLNTLFFALAVAMLVSVFCWQGRTAAGLTFSLLLAFGGLLPAAGVATGQLSGVPTAASLLAFPCPVFAFLLAPAVSYTPAPWMFWTSLTLTHGVAWLLLAVCCRLLPRAWQERPAGRRRFHLREWYRKLLWGGPGIRAVFRRRLLEINPIFWLSSRELRRVWHPWIFLGSMTVIAVFSFWALRPAQAEMFLCMNYALHFFFKYWVAVEASHAFSTDRDKGALELLLSTPLGVREIVRGHGLALRRLFLRPLATMVILEAAGWILFLLQIIGRRGPNEEFPWVFAGAVGLVILVADLAALIWTGWWMGATSKNAAQATARTVMRVCILPWGLTVAIVFFGFTFIRDPEDMAFPTTVVIYLVASLIVDGVLLQSARFHLVTGLRSAASLRYSSGLPTTKEGNRRRGWPIGGRESASENAGTLTSG